MQGKYKLAIIQIIEDFALRKIILVLSWTRRGSVLKMATSDFILLLSGYQLLASH